MSKVSLVVMIPQNYPPILYKNAESVGKGQDLGFGSVLVSV